MYRKTYIDINIDNLCDNVSNIVNTFSGYDYYIGVIKGNAYGHGEYISKWIVDSGINYLAVSSLEEAINVRKYNVDTPILCLEPIDLEYIDDVIKYNVTICVSNISYYKKLCSLKYNGNVKFHLKLNTGMNRLGVSSSCEVKEIFDNSIDNDKLFLEGIFSHLATPGIFDSLYKRQIDCFKKLVSDIDLSKVKIVHIGRSCTLDFFCKNELCNGVRIGIMLYGVQSTFPVYRKGFLGKIQRFKRLNFYKKNNLPIPFSSNLINLKQSLSLKSEVIEVQYVKKGEYVGYGSSCMVDSDCYVAIIPLGYADGISTHYNNLSVLVNGKKYDVIGSINMGMISILVDDSVKIGDVVVFIDEDISYKKVCKCFGLTPYVFLTNLRREIPRRYFKDGKVVKVVLYDKE